MFSFKYVVHGLALVVAASAMACSATDDTAGESGNAAQSAVTGRAEVYEGNDGQFYFRLVAKNGETVLRSEGYSARAAAVEGINTAVGYVRNSNDSSVAEAASGEFFFRVVAANGEPVAVSQLYASEAAARAGREMLSRVAAGQLDMSDAQTGARFEAFQSEADGQFYFRLVAKNGETVLQSQGYATRGSVKRAISTVRRLGEDAAHFEVRDARDGQFFAVLSSANGRKLGKSELFTRRSSAERSVSSIVALLKSISVPGEDLTGGSPENTCEGFPVYYGDFFETPAWHFVDGAEWAPDQQTLTPLQEKQLVAAVNVLGHVSVTTVAEAFENVDQGLVNYGIVENANDFKTYVVIEYGSGDNSFGGVFEENGETVVAKINDSDIYCSP